MSPTKSTPSERIAAWIAAGMVLTISDDAHGPSSATTTRVPRGGWAARPASWAFAAA